MNTLHSPSEFLSAILEGFLDGILVVTVQKQLLYINHAAHHLCHRLTTQTENSVPAEIWQVCQAFIESQELHAKELMMESDIEREGMTLLVRVQWLTLNGVECPCLLVRLQDHHQVIQTTAIAEAQQWHLTERETQVWLLRRANCSRKQIASELYISEDTVKKHLGNIRSKRKSYLDEEEWQLHYAQSEKQLRSA